MFGVLETQIQPNINRIKILNHDSTKQINTFVLSSRSMRAKQTKATSQKTAYKNVAILIDFETINN